MTDLIGNSHVTPANLPCRDRDSQVARISLPGLLAQGMFVHRENMSAPANPENPGLDTPATE